jgi:hypothetical protein
LRKSLGGGGRELRTRITTAWEEGELGGRGVENENCSSWEEEGEPGGRELRTRKRSLGGGRTGENWEGESENER